MSPTGDLGQGPRAFIRTVGKCGLLRGVGEDVEDEAAARAVHDPLAALLGTRRLAVPARLVVGVIRRPMAAHDLLGWWLQRAVSKTAACLHTPIRRPPEIRGCGMEPEQVLRGSQGRRGPRRRTVADEWRVPRGRLPVVYRESVQPGEARLEGDRAGRGRRGVVLAVPLGRRVHHDARWRGRRRSVRARSGGGATTPLRRVRCARTPLRGSRARRGRAPPPPARIKRMDAAHAGPLQDDLVVARQPAVLARRARRLPLVAFPVPAAARPAAFFRRRDVSAKKLQRGK